MPAPHPQLVWGLITLFSNRKFLANITDQEHEALILSRVVSLSFGTTHSGAFGFQAWNKEIAGIS